MGPTVSIQKSGWGNPERVEIVESKKSAVASPKLEEMQDADLLSNFASGNSEAFQALFLRYRKPLYNFIARTVRDQDIAEDLLQDAFSRIVQRAEELRGESKFTIWLYTITLNLCVDQARKGDLRRYESLNEPSESIENGTCRLLRRRVVDHQPGADRHTISNQLRETIANAVETLPEKQREVFLMRQIQNMPFHEIAIVVGVSENTVKSRMRYALERLREKLTDYEE
ncbi:MAG: sigma-70 family RNA polymerase sigma factor [Deltaproteobacteria bacterium]|nr:sigma-70 family RNA polymerase sigma factor [Deltaproteobacteria bacterium]